MADLNGIEEGVRHIQALLDRLKESLRRGNEPRIIETFNDLAKTVHLEHVDCLAELTKDEGPER